MYLSHIRFRTPVLTLAASLLVAAAAEAAPPPGMRWGDHSGLSPSVPRSGRGVSSGTVIGTYGSTTYAQRWGRPVVVWRHQPAPAVIGATYAAPSLAPSPLIGPIR